jgi:hypothetical protein
MRWLFISEDCQCRFSTQCPIDNTLSGKVFDNCTWQTHFIPFKNEFEGDLVSNFNTVVASDLKYFDTSHFLHSHLCSNLRAREEGCSLMWSFRVEVRM